MSVASGTRLKFLDCNMRIGRAGIVRPEHILDAPGLIAEMDYAGIDRALVYHAWSQEWDPAGGNRQLLNEIAGLDRFLPCYVGLPHATGELGDVDDFAAEVSQAHGAVRLYPKAHQYCLAEWCMGPTLHALAEAGVPVLLEMAQFEWNELAEILRHHPRLNVVVLQTSYRVNRYIFPLFQEFDNLYLETCTYQVMRGLEEVTRKYGPHRLVFGTGLPLTDAGGPIAQITYAELDLETKQAIAGGNMARLLGLEWPIQGSGA
ncbi:MAG: amidohydrolase family protein [Armatimonadetes bacterium]|nr:amidohydrolase family protein [Armatimonadota bacterium]